MAVYVVSRSGQLSLQRRPHDILIAILPYPEGEFLVVSFRHIAQLCQTEVKLCAGINRQEAENENFSRERSSEPLGPEFCAVVSRGLQ